MRTVLFVAAGAVVGCGAGFAGGMAYAMRDMDNPGTAIYVFVAMTAGTFAGALVGAGLA